MNDLISRRAAINTLHKEIIKRRLLDDVNDGMLDEFDTEDILRKLPSAYPKKGKWIKTGRWGRVYQCDQCRNYLDFDGVNAGRGSTNYCPNCGARMEE